MRRVDRADFQRHAAGMSTIVEADETGALRLPAALLPHPGPHRRYRVAAGNGRVVVDEAAAEPRKPTGFVRKWGGSANDYFALHQWFDATKAHLPDNRHRMLLHNSFGMLLAVRLPDGTLRLVTTDGPAPSGLDVT